MTRPGAPVLRILTILACLGVASPARAQRDPATAEALFIAGRQAIERGDYPTACARFAESDRLDPAAGTRINLADCEERIGRVASAWARWKDAIDLLAPTDPRLPAARRRAVAIETRVPRITFELAGPPPPGLRVLKNGVELGAGALGVPLPENPGEHVVVVTAPGREPRETTVTLAEGETLHVTLELGAPEATAAPAPSPAPAVAADDAPELPPPASPLRTLGWVSLGVGGAGVAIGTVSGILALARKSDVEQNCFPARVCNAEGASAARSGRTAALVSTIGFAAGALALAGGAYLLVRSGPSSGSKTAIAPFGSPGGGGVGMVGTF